MPDFYDLCIENKSEDITSLMDELGWNTERIIQADFLEAHEWGELKRKISEHNSESGLIIFKGGNEELNRKAVEDSRVDILLHPEKGRKDSGINHVTAKKASENNVAIGLDFKQLNTTNKKRSHIFRHWRRNMKLCEKYGADYLITTRAKEIYDLRSPRDLENLINSLGYNGKKAVSKTPSKIIENS